MQDVKWLKLYINNGLRRIKGQKLTMFVFNQI